MYALVIFLSIIISAISTLVDPITTEGISTAGFSGYTLICNTSKTSYLPSASTLAVEWLSPSGNVINSGTNFTITGTGPTTNVVLTSRLTFNILLTSQAGVYTCRSLQTLPGVIANHPTSVTFLVQVKCMLLLAIISISESLYLIYTVPIPFSPPIFHRSRNTSLNAGTSFTLTCIINLNTNGVDSDFTVQSSITGPGISDTSRVSIFHPTLVRESTFNATVTFNYLLEGDTGVYGCTALITSSHSNIIASDSVFGSESINVGRKSAT